MKLMLHTEPCIVEEGKITANAKLGLRLNLESKLDAFKKEFGEAVYSEKLELLKINWKGKSIMVFRNGNISVRKADNEKDAVETIKAVCRVLGV